MATFKYINVSMKNACQYNRYGHKHLKNYPLESENWSYTSVQNWPKLTTSILISTPTYAIVALTCQYIIKLLPLSHLTDTYKLPVIKLYLTQSGQLQYLCNMYIRWQSSHNNIPVSDEHRYIQNKPVMFIHTILYIVLYWRMKIIFWWYFFGMKDFSQLYSLLFTKKKSLIFAC